MLGTFVGSFDEHLCTNEREWAIYDTSAFAGVKICWRPVAPNFEFAIEVADGQWAAIGLSTSAIGMQDLDVYSFTSEFLSVQNRYANSETTPQVENTPLYAQIKSTAKKAGVGQVIFQRPVAGIGHRKSLKQGTTYVVCTAGIRSSVFSG